MLLWLPALFVVTGATALSLEVIWERELRLLLGASTWSVAIVTAAFMGGLGIGYHLGRHGRIRRAHPLLVYGVAEALVAVYALLFPVILSLAGPIHLATGGLLAARAAVAFAVLLPPTILMGVSLAPITRLLAPKVGAGRAAGLLYGANTAGGVLGTLATSWFALEAFGARGTSLVAVGANFAVAAVVLAASRRAGPPAEPAVPEATRGGWDPALSAAAFLAGFQLMGLQVVWNRTLVCAVESHTTSFALIVAVVLLGSAIGATAYAAVAPWIRARPSRPFLAFLVVEAALGIASVGSLRILNALYDVGGTLAGSVGIQTVADLLFVRFVIAAAPVVPVAALGAFLLPLLVDVLREDRDADHSVATVFAADAAGSVAGALVAGFGLIPWLGLTGSIVGLGHLAVGTGVLLLLARRRLVVPAVAVGLAAIGVALVVATPLTLTRWYDGHQGVAGELIHYDEGTFGTLAVFRVDGRKELLINCIEEVPDHRDARLLFKVLGHAPMLLHDDPEQVLVNAIGGGITLGAVTLHDAEVEAVELVPEVLDAMPLFAEENNSVAERDDWTLIHDDGRNHLQVSEKTYDVVTADATHPAAGESWPLYTREYYEIVREHLADDGLFAQWLPLHNLVSADFRSVIRTFASVFEDTVVLFVNRYCVLLGSPRRIELDPEAVDRRLDRLPGIREDLAPYGIESAADLLRYVVLDREGVDEITRDAWLQTDDRASVEFAELHRLGVPSTFPANVDLLGRHLDPRALAKRTSIPSRYFAARGHLMLAQLRSAQPSLESAQAALMDLRQARELNRREVDADEPRERVVEVLARLVHRDYEEILEREDLHDLLLALDEARNHDPQDPLPHEVLGLALVRLRLPHQAVEPLATAADLAPQNVAFVSNLVFALDQAGRTTEALAALEHLEEIDPDNPSLGEVRRRLEARAE